MFGWMVCMDIYMNANIQNFMAEYDECNPCVIQLSVDLMLWLYVHIDSTV